MKMISLRLELRRHSAKSPTVVGQQERSRREQFSVAAIGSNCSKFPNFSAFPASETVPSTSSCASKPPKSPQLPVHHHPARGPSRRQNWSVVGSLANRKLAKFLARLLGLIRCMWCSPRVATFGEYRRIFFNVVLLSLE